MNKTMSRQTIINKIGQKYLSTNIENDEFSYIKVGVDCSYVEHKFLDLRFVDDKKKVAVLVETKQSFTDADKAQLDDYVKLEKKFTNYNIVAILANTNDDRCKTWFYAVGEREKRVIGAR
jgi:hypothetical protein